MSNDKDNDNNPPDKGNPLGGIKGSPPTRGTRISRNIFGMLMKVSVTIIKMCIKLLNIIKIKK